MKQCFKIILTLHERKIFHRDLKPAQFLVFEKYKIKLSDFGSYYIKPTAEDTTISQKGGFTYNYWAPEYKYMEKQVVKNKKKF
jgi:serine/threonine protein kinase